MSMNSSPDDEDLEDGEIASDDDEPSDNGQGAERKEVQEPEKKPGSAVGSSPKSSGKSVSHQSEENDFEKDLQKLKEDVERKKIKKDAKKRRENERDNNNKRRKHKSLDDGKNRKKRKVEGGKGGDKSDEEDMDDDEMLGLCIRGASPTVNLDQVEVWSSKQPINDPNWQFHEHSENESGEDRDDRKRRRRGEKERRNFKQITREDKEIKKRLQMKRKGKNRKDMDSSDMICINFMKGNCNKGNDCFYSHAVCPPKKMELCKFYLMDCCAKRDKCLYLHEEFPCKFFHTGLKCYSGKKCKFSHDPLNSLSKDILLKHLETAPKEILGDFPRLSRDCAETMVNNKTIASAKSADTSKIPSLFDIQVSIPFEFQNTGDKTEERTTPPCSPPPNVKNSPKTKSKDESKFYQDQCQDENERPSGSPMDFALELEAYKSHQSQGKNSDETTDKESNQGVKSEGKGDDDGQSHRRHVKATDDSEGGETEEREGKRRKKKHDFKRSKKNKRKDDNAEEDEEEDEEERNRRKGEVGRKSRKERKSKKESQKSEKSESNAVRLSEDGSFGGIKFKIINRKEIRKSSDSDKDVLLPMKIEKPHEFLSSDDDKPLNYFVKKGKKDVVEDKTCDDVEKFGVEIKPEVDDETDENEPENKLIIETNDEPEEDEKPEEPVVPKHLPRKQRELFLRIQAQNQKVKDEEKRKKEAVRERKTSVGSGSGSEAEAGKTPPPEPADEDWYSSDEENVKKEENSENSELCSLNNSKTQSPDSTTRESNSSLPQSYAPPTTTKPKIDIPALNGSALCKINITELLSSIRQVTSKKSNNSPDASVKPSPVPSAASYEPPKIENPIKINFFNSEPEKKEVKDPRSRDPRLSSESKVSSSRRNSDDHLRTGKSIYDSANLKMDAHDSDLRFQSKFDSDERLKSLESIVPFGDVDLRNLGGQGEQGDCDFDMRKFGLPFKPIPVHSAATEIDASLNSHPPINYKVEAILIPRPDYSGLKLNPSDPQVKRDPRLRRLFRINSAEADPKEEQQKKSGLPSDPRQRKQPVADTPKSPTESPFSPKQNDPVMAAPNLLNANLLLLAQLGLSAAAAGTNVFDPRVQQLLNKTPQELELLRNHLSTLKTQSDFDLFRNQLINNENVDMIRPPGQGLLPTPLGAPGMGLLGPAPGFMMPGINIPDPSVMMGPMAQLGQNPMGFDPRFTSNSNEDDMKDNEVRHFNRGFRNDRRGRGSWRGNRDRNWDRDNRRHNKPHNRDDRDRSRHNRDRDDRKERKRSSTPD